jgi:hypothetical protein
MKKKKTIFKFYIAAFGKIFQKMQNAPPALGTISCTELCIMDTTN